MPDTKTLTHDDVRHILDAFTQWINQSPDLDPANYGCHIEQLKYSTPGQRVTARRAMAGEAATISKDGTRARKALKIARQFPPNPEAMREALNHAYSGRLSWTGSHFDYTTGQYWSTEYRKAAAAVLEEYNDTVRPKHTPRGKVPHSIDELVKMNEAAGGKFFSRDNMRFFRSRVLSDLFIGTGGVYFVTSEKKSFDKLGRVFHVRRFDCETGSVESIGGNFDYSRARALRWALALANRFPPACDRCEGSKTLQRHDGTQETCWQCKGSGTRAAAEVADEVKQ